MPAGVLEKLYYKTPVFFQNAVFGLYSWNVSRRRYSKSFHEQLARLKGSEWWPAERIRAYQEEKFLECVRRAHATVPFYREWFDEHRISIRDIQSLEDLAQLPVLTKEIAKANQSALISTAFPRRTLVRALTSGTTGTPLTVYLTRDAVAFQWAIWWRHKARFGLSPGDKHLMFGARVPIDLNQSSPPYWRKNWSSNRVYLSTYHISPRTIRDIVDFLNETDFVFYTGYPSAMYAMACMMEEAGLTLTNPPNQIVSGSDALLPNYEALIRRVFQAPLTEQYGMTEFAGNLSKCEAGMFHVDFECCAVEQVPIKDSNCCKLVLTGWGNPAMPFVRYEVGDYAVPCNAPCSCGRQSQAYYSIDGRLEDYILTPDGRKIVGMNQVFEYAKHAKEIQLVQNEIDTVEFRIVPENGFGEEDEQALTREFSRRAGAEIKITFRIVQQITRSSTGKFRAVISGLK